MKYKITTQVATEPVTLSEARKHLRIEPFGYPLKHPDDTYIDSLITIAREWCEQYTGRALATQTVVAATTGFPAMTSDYDKSIKLPLFPVQSVTSVQYLNTAGVLTTMPSTDYYVDMYEGRIFLQLGKSWPETADREDSVTVTYVAGYTNNEVSNTYPMPMPIKAAMLLLIGNYYENRQEDVVAGTKATFNSLPMGVKNLLQSYRLNMGV
jgi:uncharacterized phiE125 gp8 family phage protein